MKTENHNLLYLLLLFTSFSFGALHAQQLNQKINNQNLQINICDDDSDGFYNFNINEIEDFVIKNIGISNSNLQEEILISTQNANVISIKNPSSNLSISTFCNLGASANGRFTDIAINSKKEIFTCGSGFLSIDNSCQITNYPYSFFNGNALSFDDLDNVYVGYSTESYVLNFKVVGNDLEDFEIWHDFNVGSSGGDFVLLDDKMYVAWTLSRTNFRLYEITVDDERNYISHKDLGQLPDNTFGLASELGTLYGITPNKLFKIDIDNFTFTDIVQNPNPDDQWYGAAGLNEAITYKLSTHITNKQAEDGAQPLTGVWKNTIMNQQTIYIRIENSLTKTYEIVNLELNISKYPDVNQPQNLVKCVENNFEMFDLNEVAAQMTKNTSDNLTYSFYNLNPELNPNITQIDKIYNSTRAVKTIYVKVDNGNCNLTFEFSLINNEKPNLAEFSTLQTPTLLEKCYFDDKDLGFFNLNEIEETIILENKNFTTKYYLNYTDAQDDINQISTLFYLENLVQEIYVRVTDEYGCFSITNFFLNEDCLQNENPILFITFPKFMTPNNDNNNDYWNITGGSGTVIDNSTITIFNRFGKKLFSFSPKKSNGWDGTYEGKTLPASNYWFLFTTETGLKKTGYFSIVR